MRLFVYVNPHRQLTARKGEPELPFGRGIYDPDGLAAS
jgi:hypothetical protein